MTKEEIIQEYEVTEEDILAASQCMPTELIGSEEFHPLPIRTGEGDACNKV